MGVFFVYISETYFASFIESQIMYDEGGGDIANGTYLLFMEACDAASEAEKAELCVE